MRILRVLNRFCCIALLSIFSLSTTAQYYDSLNFVDLQWQKEKIAKGVKLYSKHFNSKNLFRSNQYITYVKIKKRANVFEIAADPKTLKTTSDFATESNAVAAVNGNFFDMKNGGAVDYTKKNGQIINANRVQSNQQRAFHQKAGVVITNGSLQIVKWDGFVNWEENLSEDDVMLSGPLLYLKNVFEKLDSTSSFTMTRHPRTCVGVTKRGKVIMLVADGRNANARGLNLFELSKVMRWLKCVSAINFDGAVQAHFGY